MKQFLPDAVKAVILTAILLSVVILAGCPEGEKMIAPVTEHVEMPPPTTVGEIKDEKPTITEVAEEPDATVDTVSPKVTKVAYYADWKLTKPITDTVEPGMTIYTKVVFSRQMQHVVSDEDDARPILSFLIKKEGAEKGILTRYKIAGHDAGGEDFVSGDAKPLQSGTEDYVCKYVVPKEMVGTFGLLVGAQNADTDGTILGEVYHGKKLVLKQAIPADTVAPTVVSITHYHSGNPLEEGDMVTEGSVIRTEVLFSEPMEVLPRRGHTARPVLTHTIHGVTEQFTVSLHRNIAFGHCRPSRNNTLFTCKMRVDGDYTVSVGTDSADVAGNHLVEGAVASTLVVVSLESEPDTLAIQQPTPAVTVPDADTFVGSVYMPDIDQQRVPVSEATVTVMSGSQSGKTSVTDSGGQYIFPGIAEDTVNLRVEKNGFETKEVTVSQHVTETILVGHSIPNEIQSIFSVLKVHPNILLVKYGGNPGGRSGGEYVHPVAYVYHTDHNLRRNTLRIIAHEFFHSHQMSSGGFSAWTQTPEGSAYLDAEKKDFETVGTYFYYDKTGPSYESAADLFSYYWGLRYLAEGGVYEHIKTGSPNRYAWATQWFE